MKRFYLCLLLMIFIVQLIVAEVSLSGKVEIGLTAVPAFPYNQSRFNTPLNKDNYQGIQDLMPVTDFLAKLSGQDEATDFSVWLAVKPYYLGQALLAASTGPGADADAQTAAVGESLPLLGFKINTIAVLRANIGWFISDFLVLRIGRQSMLTGYGYGWNPIDFFNPLKDPYDPDLELRGVDALTAQFYLGNVFAMKLAGIYRTEGLTGGIDFGDLQAGAEITASLPGMEVKATGFFDHDQSEGEDSYVPALGLGIKADIGGAGIYGEGSLLKGSRYNFPTTPTVDYSRKKEWLFTGLLGIEYTFETEISATLEYFYNGEGFDLDDRRLYREGLNFYNSSGVPPTDYLLMYRPGYFARHYLLLNLYLPLYDLNTDIQLACLYSPDSWVLNVLPLITFNVSGSFSIDLGYVGLFSLKSDQEDEARLSPIKHMLKLLVRYDY
ncbi:MAG: hypothetical protein KAR73_10105 [Spirochaetales bacterium]|nr:hypothetical protein [Spirochaetales bacterium]